MTDKPRTVAASYVPALFNIHRHITRWQLWQRYANNVQLPKPEGLHLTIGKLLQDDIIELAAAELELEVLEVPQEQDNYWINPDTGVGCIADGFVQSAEGLGFIECKAVGYWARMDWRDGSCPLEVELQHQTQLMVPHPELGPPAWGAIAALIGTEFVLLKRTPNMDAQRRIAEEVARLFAEVDAGEEPALAGEETETETLAALFPAPLDKAEWKALEGDGMVLAEQYVDYAEAAKAADDWRKHLRPQVLALAGTAGVLSGPGLELKIVGKHKTIRHRRTEL